MHALREHLERNILGWWSKNGADDEIGGVRTCFTNQGELLSTDRYTWSQGRWAWVASLVADDIDAGRISGDSQLWRTRSAHTADWLLHHAFCANGSTAFRVDEKGNHLPDEEGRISTSVFADLFAVLGLAGAARAHPDRAHEWAPRAEATLERAAMQIRTRTALSEPYPVPDGFRDLAGPMTLLHAAAELYRAVPSEGAQRIAAEAHNALLDPATGFLGEDRWWEFVPDADSDTDTMLARHVTPGHLIELLWMMVHAGQALPELKVSPTLLECLALRALEVGWDAEHGGLLRYVDRDRGGKPQGRMLHVPYEDLVTRTWDTKLWWVHAEAMYGSALLAVHTGSEQLAQWAQRLSDWTLDTFPDPAGGEWIQIRARDGSPLDEVVALPVKDPMHVARSLLLLNALQTKENSDHVR